MEELDGILDRWDPRQWEDHIPASGVSPRPSPNEHCEVCGGIEYVDAAPPGSDIYHPLFGKMSPCPACLERTKGQRTRDLFRRSAISKRHRSCRFETYNVGLFPAGVLKGARTTQRRSATAAVEATQKWAALDAPPFLTLLSPPGTGKTHLAAAAIWEFSLQGIRSYYLPAGRLATRARSADRKDLQPFFDFLQRVAVVVLDDVGAEYDSEYMRSVYHGIIDARYLDPELRTLIISNLGEEDLTARLGARVIDRLVEAGTGISVVIEAESVRESLPS